MPTTQPTQLARTFQLIAIIIGATAMLYFGKSVLVPLAFGLVLAMLLLPISRWLEGKGVPKALAAVVGILLLIAFFALIFTLLSWQLSSFSDDSEQMRRKFDELVRQVQNHVSQKLGMPKSEQKQMLKEGNSSMLSSVPALLSGVMGTVVDLILVLVYVFLFLVLRGHLLDGLSMAVPADQRVTVRRVLREAGGVSQQYLLGLAMMIGCLWVMYGIGFSLVGVKYALFFAVLCGTLELIPFIGNVTGTILTVAISLVQGADMTMIGGILLTYGAVQFFQSYVLEPLIVGRQVDLNPFATILCIVLGEAVWGVPGMVLAVPLTGMFKIACDHFEPLKPYGFLLGGVPKEKKKK